MNRSVMLFAGCLLLTYLLAHAYRAVALRLLILDKPNHRSAHQAQTPTGAGLSFILVFLASFTLPELSAASSTDTILQILPALMVVAVVGLLDDYRPLPWPLRAAMHLLCCAYVIWITGYPHINLMGQMVDLGWLGSVLAVVGLLWLLNLYNFMDGIDGIATLEALSVMGFAFAITLYLGLGDIPQPLIVLAAVCSGFLVINWPQARVFMGDIGSGFLGLVFGVFIVTQTMLPLWSWLILMGWFITDATVTITVRLFRGETISEAHSQHLYQHLNRAVGTQRTLFGLVLINTFWLFPLAFAASIFQELGAVLLGLAYLPIIIFQYYCGAGQPTSKFMGREAK
jgi:Fuc2NAc and GlcNAc transferase